MTIRPIIDNNIQAIAKIYTDNWKITYQDILSDSFLESMTYEHSKKSGCHIFIQISKERLLQ